MSINDNVSRALILFAMIVAFVQCATAVSAVPISDLPEELADALEINEVAARMILVSGILLGVGLLTTISAKGNIATTSIILLAVLGMLTAIGWADPWLIIMAALVLALMFGSRLREWGEGVARGKE